MTIENKSEFLSVQEDVCEVTKKEERKPDKLCPTCKPDENFIPPQWWSMDKPFLNKKTCEYSLGVSINQYGDTYNIGNLADFVGKNSFEALKRSYVRPAIRQMLRYYDKLESDDVICGLPPENPGEECGDIIDVNYRDYLKDFEHPHTMGSKTIYHSIATPDDTAPTVTGRAVNMDALEVYARTPEFRFSTIRDSGILQVLVTIPAFAFDKVPDAPDLPEIDTSTEKVTMKAEKFYLAIRETVAAFRVFAGFQSFFHKSQNGNLFFEESGDPFFLKFAANRLNDFLKTFEALIESNGMRFGGGVSFLPKAHEIEIVFDKSDKNKPFTIKRVRAKQKNCKWKKMKVAFKSFKKRGSVKDQTTMGYIANIEDIHTAVTARETPPWLDFTVRYTYPQLSIDFGSANKFPGLDTCLQDTNAISKIVLDTALSFSDAFAYQLNKANCLTMYGKEYIMKNFPADYNEEEIEEELEKKGLKEKVYEFTKNHGFDAEAFENLDSDLKLMYIKYYIAKKYKEQKKRIANESPLIQALSEFRQAFVRDKNYFGPLGTLIDMLNPCSFKDFMLTILKCLFRGMEAKTAYSAVIKGTIGNLAAAGLEIVIQALPADKQDEIREKVEQEFSGMPAPWDDSWESGSLRASRQANQEREVEQKLNRKKGMGPIKDSIKGAFSKLHRFGFTGEITTGFVTTNSTLNFVMEYSTPAKGPNSFVERSGDDLPNPPEDSDELVENLKIVTEIEGRKLSEYIGDINNYVEVTLSSYAADKARSEIASIENKIDTFSRMIIESEIMRDEIIKSQQQGFSEQQIIDLYNLEVGTEEYFEILNNRILDDTMFVEKQVELKKEWNDPNSKQNKDLAKECRKECKKLLKKLLEINNESVSITESIEEAKELENWQNLPPEMKEKALREKEDQQRFSELNPNDEYVEGRLGKATGNVQKAITKAYADAIIETAEIQQIMRALDNIPGMKLIGGFISSFKCPNTHFIYPSIDSFLSTFTFDPCGSEPTDLRLPSFQQIPNLSWDFIGNLVKAFIAALKITLKEALAALMAKTAQLLDAALCKLLGGELPEPLSLMDLLGREGCKESDILKAAGAAPRGRPPLPEEEYANLARTISDAGDGTNMKNALLGNCDETYAINIVNSISQRAPAFGETLSSPEAVCEFFTMASGLLSDQQREQLQDEMDPSQFVDSITTKCLTDIEMEQRNNDIDSALSNLPKDVLNDYKQQERDRLSDSADQVINLALNGPNKILGDIIDSALGDEDPDCTDKVDTVGAVIKKAKETESFKNARAGIFGRVQKAFLDDTIEWNAFNPFNAPGILGQILCDTKGYTLNRYNWYVNLKNSNPVFAFLFPEPSPLPQTIGLHLREKFLSTEKEWNPDMSPNLSLEYDTEGIDEDPWRTSIRLYNDFNSEDLGFKVSVKTNEFNNLEFTVSETVTKQNIELINELSKDFSENDRSYRSKLMGSFIRRCWSSFRNVEIPSYSVEKMIHAMNKIVVSKLSNSLFYDSRGQTPQGFLYGYEPLEITADDLTYVNPEPGSMEYTYSEESQVLGRSLTNNPRVQFLDPMQHGGSFTSPFYNILAEERQGWFRFSQTIVSNLKGCDTADSNFMFFQDIMDKIQDEEGKIPTDERLSLAPDCVVELPFDKIGAPSTIATLGGIITAIIRMHVVDYMLRTFPINSNLDLTIGKNHSKLISKFITKVLKESLSEQASIFTSTYERGVYWLLFLEQAVQSVDRKMKNGDFEEDQRLTDLLDKINEAQKRHKIPSYSDLQTLKEIKEFDFTSTEAGAGLAGTIATGALIAGAGLGAPFIAAGIGTFGFLFGALTLNQARFSAKIGTINSVEEECMEILEYLVEEQVNFYSDVLLRTIEPRPYINDISKFFLGSSKIMVKGNIRAGEVEIEQPTGGKSNFNYGEIHNCVSTVNTNPLHGVSIASEQIDEIKSNGGFFLEKYLRITDKPPSPNAPQTTGRPSEELLSESRYDMSWLENRDSKLKGVVNIDTFKQFLAENADNIPAEANVSDFFGNAKTKLTEEGYRGSIGIKFGVRLCYIPPEDFTDPAIAAQGTPASPTVGGMVTSTYNQATPYVSGDLPEISEDLAKEIGASSQQAGKFVNNVILAEMEKSYFLKADPRLPSSKNIFPLCSFEQDVLDNKLTSYIESDENFNQELKCYVDGLVETPEFSLLFDHIINIKKVPSLVSLYSYLNFYASLGKGSGEREDADDVRMPDLSEVFSDTKHELRKLFVANYKRKDFDPPNEEDSEGGFTENAARDLLSKTVNNIFIAASVPWWAKWKYKRKKVDEDGEICKNQFGGLITLTSGG
jgi:hypothetical protein